MVRTSRLNEATRTEESWRPPAFEPIGGVLSQLKASARRCLDLQAASLWYDLKGPLGKARGEVLDVGAGAQPYRRLVGEHAVYRAIDTSDARANFGYDIPDTQYFGGDIWPVDSGSIDLVISTETIEHVPDPDAFLREAWRVLKGNGQLLLTVPFSARWHFVPHDYWRFTPAGLKLILERAGFTDIVVHARGNEVTVASAKCLALFLPFVMPQGSGWQLVRRILGLAFTPLMVVLGAIGHRSLRQQGGEDCLGYTVFARVHRTDADVVKA